MLGRVPIDRPQSMGNQGWSMMWPSRWLFKIDLPMFVRLVCDIVLLNIAIVSAFVLRILWDIGSNAQFSISELDRYIAAYIEFVWMLNVITILLFIVSGFYAKSSAYYTKMKAMLVIQTVTVARRLSRPRPRSGPCVVQYPSDRLGGIDGFVPGLQALVRKLALYPEQRKQVSRRDAGQAG